MFNSRVLQLECARVLHEILIVHVLMITAVQMDNFRGLMGIRRVDKI